MSTSSKRLAEDALPVQTPPTLRVDVSAGTVQVEFLPNLKNGAVFTAAIRTADANSVRDMLRSFEQRPNMLTEEVANEVALYHANVAIDHVGELSMVLLWALAMYAGICDNPRHAMYKSHTVFKRAYDQLGQMCECTPERVVAKLSYDQLGRLARRGYADCFAECGIKKRIEERPPHRRDAMERVLAHIVDGAWTAATEAAEWGNLRAIRSFDSDSDVRVYRKRLAEAFNKYATSHAPAVSVDGSCQLCPCAEISVFWACVERLQRIMEFFPYMEQFTVCDNAACEHCLGVLSVAFPVLPPVSTDRFSNDWNVVNTAVHGVRTRVIRHVIGPFMRPVWMLRTAMHDRHYALNDWAPGVSAFERVVTPVNWRRMLPSTRALLVEWVRTETPV